MFSNNAVRVILFLLSLTLFVCCSEKPQPKDYAPEVKKRLARLDSLACELNPACLSEIDKAQRTAKDSMEWYAYEQIRAAYYGTSDTPDSLVPIAHRVIAFAESRTEATPATEDLLGEAYECLAVRLQRYQQSPDEAIRLRSIAYQHTLRSNAQYRLPDLCGNLADIYMLKSDMTQAASWYRRALFLADSLETDPARSATLYIGLATIHMRTENYRAAEENFHRAEQYYSRLSIGMQIYFLNSLGNLYYFSGNYKSAKSVFLKLEKKLTDMRIGGADKAVCQVNLADICLNLGNFSEAEEYLRAAESFFHEARMTPGIFYANTVRIGMAARGEHAPDISPLLASETFSHPADYGLLSIRYRYLREYYRRRGDWQKACDVMERSEHLRNSVASANQLMRTAEMAARFREDTLSLHHQMLMRKAGDDLRNSQIAITLLIIIIIAAVAVTVMYFRRKRTQTEMDIMQLRLANARNRISPHFVFNVLNNYMAGRSEEEQSQLLSLVKLIRANLNITRNTFVSLADEMNFVRRYIEVEGQMLGPDFQYTEHISHDIDTQRTLLPAMCVQILAENALKHALRELDGPKRLTIDIDNNGTETTIRVRDNGHGFDIRAFGRGTRTGLDIIRHTVRIINQQQHHQALTFDIHNITAATGAIEGCQAVIKLNGLRQQ